MARSKSARARTVPRQEKRPAANELDLDEQIREAKLAELEKDKVFLIETAKVLTELSALRRDQRPAFDLFFKRFSYLALIRQPEKLETVLAQIEFGARDVLQRFTAYASRFKVWLKRGSTLSVLPQPPFRPNLRANLVNGRCESADPEEPGVPVIFDYIFDDDDAQIPSAKLAELEQKGLARFMQVEDKIGRSALNDIEGCAYDPGAVTFILHQAERPYIHVLVGENVRTDDQWKAAGKVINDLQKKLYGRSKAGRPRNVAKLKRAIGLLSAPTSALKQLAYYGLDSTPENANDLAANQVYLSRVSRLVRRKDSPYALTKVRR